MNAERYVKSTPDEVAAALYRLTKGETTPESIAERYEANAKRMDEFAVKATAAKSGKHRGFTAEYCREGATDLRSRAVSVADAYRAIVAERAA